MTHTIQKLLTIIFLISVSLYSEARIYQGEPFSLKQPDGTLVPVLVWGTEYYQEVESPDGYTLIREQSGWICYANITVDGNEYVSTQLQYNGTSQLPASLVLLSKHLRISAEAIKASTMIMQQQMAAITPKNLSHSRLKSLSSLPDTVRGLTLLIDFPDVKSSITKQQLRYRV